MIKKLLLGTTALLALAGVAAAADLPVKGPIYQPAAPLVYGGWTGLYGGLQLGYGWDWSGVDFQNTTTDVATLGNSPQGITGGLRLGYDMQLGGPLVFGIVTDINLADFKSNTSNPAVSGMLVSPVISSTTSWWGTTNGRLGLSTFGDHILPYITGGVAYGEGRTNITSGALAFDASKTLVGWNAGVGIETRITKNISAFIEGKFVDLGDVVVPITTTATGPVIGTGTQPFKFGVVEGGINYRF